MLWRWIWLQEIGLFFRSFWEDWFTSMTTVGSLLCAFAKPLAELIPPSRIASLIKDSPTAALWLVSALLFLLASYRVWMREHRNRLALPLERLLEESQSLARQIREFKGAYGFGEDYYVLSTPAGSAFAADRERCLKSVAIRERALIYQSQLRRALDDIGRISVGFVELNQAHKFYHLAEYLREHEALIEREVERLRRSFWLSRDKPVKEAPIVQAPPPSLPFGKPW